jgi:hypothetical protein
MKTIYVGIECVHNKISICVATYRIGGFSEFYIPQNLVNKFVKNIKASFLKEKTKEIKVINVLFENSPINHRSIQYNIAVQEMIIKDSNEKFKPYIDEEIQKFMINHAEKFI